MPGPLGGITGKDIAGHVKVEVPELEKESGLRIQRREDGFDIFEKGEKVAKADLAPGHFVASSEKLDDGSLIITIRSKDTGLFQEVKVKVFKDKDGRVRMRDLATGWEGYYDENANGGLGGWVKDEKASAPGSPVKPAWLFQ